MAVLLPVPATGHGIQGFQPSGTGGIGKNGVLLAETQATFRHEVADIF